MPDFVAISQLHVIYTQKTRKIQSIKHKPVAFILLLLDSSQRSKAPQHLSGALNTDPFTHTSFTHQSPNSGTHAKFLIRWIMNTGFWPDFSPRQFRGLHHDSLHAETILAFPVTKGNRDNLRVFFSLMYQIFGDSCPRNRLFGDIELHRKNGSVLALSPLPVALGHS